MRCKTLLMRMSKYIDGELERELCKELERHLKGCDRCRIVLNTTKQTIEFYRGTKAYEIPRAVHQRLHRALQKQWKKSQM